jgi:hypothetical protein
MTIQGLFPHALQGRWIPGSLLIEKYPATPLEPTSRQIQPSFLSKSHRSSVMPFSQRFSQNQIFFRELHERIFQVIDLFFKLLKADIAELVLFDVIRAAQAFFHDLSLNLD